MAKSASFKCGAWKGASEASITVLGGESVTLKPDKDGTVKTTDERVITALRSDPAISEINAPAEDGATDPKEA